jgi:hypothetical protein
MSNYDYNYFKREFENFSKYMNTVEKQLSSRLMSFENLKKEFLELKKDQLIIAEYVIISEDSKKNTKNDVILISHMHHELSLIQDKFLSQIKHLFENFENRFMNFEQKVNDLESLLSKINARKKEEPTNNSISELEKFNSFMPHLKSTLIILGSTFRDIKNYKTNIFHENAENIEISPEIDEKLKSDIQIGLDTMKIQMKEKIEPVLAKLKNISKVYDIHNLLNDVDKSGVLEFIKHSMKKHESENENVTFDVYMPTNLKDFEIVKLHSFYHTYVNHGEKKTHCLVRELRERSTTTINNYEHLKNEITYEEVNVNQYEDKLKKIVQELNKLYYECVAFNNYVDIIENPKSHMDRVKLLSLLGITGISLSWILNYTYKRLKNYYRKQKLWKKLENVTPKLMWILIEPHDSESKIERKKMPPYDEVSDVIQYVLHVPEKLELKRINKSKLQKSPLFGFQTKMTIDLLPEIRDLILEELKRRQIVTDKLIADTKKTSDFYLKKHQKIYIPVSM